MSIPKKISLKELRDEAESSSLRKGMFVRCLPMHGSWIGFEGAEFFVLSDEAKPMWGHMMAIRHCFDTDPDTAQMLTKAKDKEGKTLFYFIYLPESCVQILDQSHWTEVNQDKFLAEDSWKESWNKMLVDDAKIYHKYKKKWEETGDEEDRRWMHLFRPRKTWDEAKLGEPGIFQDGLLNLWVRDENDE